MTATLDDLSTLGQRIAAEVTDAVRMPRLDAVRAALQEVGIRRARAAVPGALERIAAAQGDLRGALDAEREAKDRLAAEVLAVEWELDGRFVVEANKHWLIGDDGVKDRTMTADERAKWKAAEAARQPTVVAATAALRNAEHGTAAARDALSLAERHFSAAKADLTASIAELQAFGIGIAAEPATTQTTNNTGGNHR